MTRCGICKHPDREELELKLASKAISQATFAKLANSNVATVSRHVRNCIPKRIKESNLKPEPTQVDGLNVVNALISSHAKTMEILADSLAEGDRRTALMALQTEIRQLELNAKLTGQLNDAPQVNFLLNPEFVRLKQILIKTLEPFPIARVRLSEALTEIALENDD